MSTKTDSQETTPTVRICDCGCPLIFTLIFAGSEYFCPNCKGTYGFLGAGKIVDLTPDLRRRNQLVEAWFNDLVKDFIPGGARLSRCEKCKGEETHLEHATDEEIEASERAYEALMGPLPNTDT